jgi:hypothetical protein
LDLVFSTSSPSTISHQRAFSLPQNSNLNVNNNQNMASSTGVNANNVNGKSFAIQPVHQRTRSLPLTEETAIDFSQSPPNFGSFGPNVIDNSKINKNNSMESIIEDYQNVDASGSSLSRSNNASNSILKHLSKLSSSNNSSSPSQLRKKRHHHNIMRSTYEKTVRYQIFKGIKT